jgi:nicotinamide phosphoribosyltransferase
MKDNPILRTDSYKMSHPWQLPLGTTNLFSYLESRGGRYGSTLFFGLQYLLKEYLTTPITKADVEEAATFCEAHGEPFAKDGWMRIVEKHNGFLPLRIKAVPEGTVVPVSNVLLTVESTDSEIPWVASWVETQIVRGIWYPTTVATLSYYCKKVILEALKESSDDPMGELPFKLHDFGARGVSSHESAGIGGMAHLVNFMGSDTIEGIRFANHYYNHPMAAFSIPATEHSTITSWGKENEVDAYRNVIQQFAKPGKIVACVSDSYDIFNAVENLWCDDLHQEVKNSEATLVIRPDSGNPAEVNVKLLQIMERKIGTPKNMKGYKVLPKYFRLIQGDGNKNEDSIREVLHALLSNGYSASNIAFGMGGGLLQQVDRDTQRFAYKCSAATVNGQEIKVFKDPITDKGKRSKAGRLDLVFREHQFQTVEGQQRDSVLVPVFENGKILKEYTLDEVRKTSEKSLR